MNINLIKKHDGIPQKNYRYNIKSSADKRNDLHFRKRKEELSISTFVKKNITNVKHTKDTHVLNNKQTKTKFPEEKINHNMRKPNLINVSSKKYSDNMINKGNDYSSSFQNRRNNINDIKKDVGIHQSDYIKNDKVTCIKYNINSRELINFNLFQDTKLIKDDQKENLSHVIKEGDKLINVKEKKNKCNNVYHNKNNYDTETIYIIDEQEKKEDCFPNNNATITLSYTNKKKEEHFFKNNYKKNDESLNINHMKSNDENVCPDMKGLSSKMINNNYIRSANIAVINKGSSNGETKKKYNNNINNINNNNNNINNNNNNINNNNINIPYTQITSKYSNVDNKKGNKEKIHDKNKNIYKDIKNNSHNIYYNIKTSTICKEKKTHLSSINNKSNIIFNNNINDNKNIVNNVNTYKNKQGAKILNINENKIKNKKINDTSSHCIENNINLKEKYINNTFIEEGNNISISNENNNTLDMEINKGIHNKKDNNYENDTYIYYKTVRNQSNCDDKISININKSKETFHETKDKLLNTLDPTMNTTYKNNDKNILNINHKEVRKGLTFEQMKRKSYEHILCNEININHDINKNENKNENENNIKVYNNNLSDHTNNNHYSDKKRTSAQISGNPIYAIKNKTIKRSTLNPKLTQKTTSKNSMSSFLLFPKKNKTTNNFFHHTNNDIKSASRNNILVKNKQIEKKKNNTIHSIMQNNKQMDEKKKKKELSVLKINDIFNNNYTDEYKEEENLIQSENKTIQNNEKKKENNIYVYNSKDIYIDRNCNLKNNVLLYNNKRKTNDNTNSLHMEIKTKDNFKKSNYKGEEKKICISSIVNKSSKFYSYIQNNDNNNNNNNNIDNNNDIICHNQNIYSNNNISQPKKKLLFFKKKINNKINTITNNISEQEGNINKKSLQKKSIKPIYNLKETNNKTGDHNTTILSSTYYNKLIKTGLKSKLSYLKNGNNKTDMRKITTPNISTKKNILTQAKEKQVAWPSNLCNNKKVLNDENKLNKNMTNPSLTIQNITYESMTSCENAKNKIKDDILKNDDVKEKDEVIKEDSNIFILNKNENDSFDINNVSLISCNKNKNDNDKYKNTNTNNHILSHNYIPLVPNIHNDKYKMEHEEFIFLENNQNDNTNDDDHNNNNNNNNKTSSSYIVNNNCIDNNNKCRHHTKSKESKEKKNNSLIINKDQENIHGQSNYIHTDMHKKENQNQISKCVYTNMYNPIACGKNNKPNVLPIRNNLCETSNRNVISNNIVNSQQNKGVQEEEIQRVEEEEIQRVVEEEEEIQRVEEEEKIQRVEEEEKIQRVVEEEEIQRVVEEEEIQRVQ
ncbi:conserved Plasmodium protein, unknown function, partial [Plasmodium sp. DRC-Itaito]